MNLLGVSRLTIYRMIKRGELKAIKVGRQWRFWEKDLEDYLAQKQFRYGTTAIGHCFFRPEVLERYRQESKSGQKYYLHEQANDGWLGNRQDYHDIKVLKSAPRDDTKKPLPPNYRPFAEVHYRKIKLKDGRVVIALTPEQYKNIPTIEYAHWASFII